jgi:two-component system chemotaxis response regulator CheY
MKVLVVDDSKVTRKFIVRLLHDLGVTEIVEAVNGTEALTQFNAGPCDIVLTDWNMPDKSGVQLVRELRAAGATVPIVMITTETERSHVVEAIQAGINDYLVKPFQKSLLLDKLYKFGLEPVC